jgi:uncharacterized protein YdiU (UPF0061 family)
LESVAAAQADLVARWLLVGFIHGVMNTDNMSVAGETIDYGPCAFMDAYDPAQVFSSIDHAGRYAYANQPRIALWNLSRLAETLLPLLSEDQQQAVDQANEALNVFGPRFEQAYHAGLRRSSALRRPAKRTWPSLPTFWISWPNRNADFTLHLPRAKRRGSRSGG